MALELEKPTPIECLEQGYPMTMARLMEPEDLTREHCIKLLEGGFEQYVIRMRYNFSGEAWFAKMKEWGLNRKATNWDFRSERNQRAPAQEKRESVAVEPPAREESIADILPVPDLPARGEITVQEQKPTAIEWLRKYGDAPSHLGQIRILTAKDLTREDAQKLLAAGVSRCMLWKMYGVATPGGPHYKLLKEMLQEPDVQPDTAKPAESGAEQVKTVLTEEEKQDLFAEPEPPISEAVAQAAAAGEIRVATVERPTPAPSDPFTDLDFEECEPKLQHAGELWIRVSLKRGGHSGGNIAFSSAAWPKFTGHNFGVEVSRDGTVIRLTENPGGKFRARGDARHVAAGNLTEKLRERGVELPARFSIEKQGEMWMGRLDVS